MKHKSINSYIKNKLHVKIEITGKNLCGYIIQTSELGILVQIVGDEFVIDGYVFIPYDSIIKIHHNKLQKFHHEILVKEGIFDQVNFSYKLNIMDSYSLFSDLYSKLICIYDFNGNSKYCRLLEYDKKYLYYINFDIYGNFNKIKSKILIENILFIELENEYLSMYKKYVS